MSVFKASQDELGSMDSPTNDTEERITKPSALRAMHSRFCHDDAETSGNRAAVQELMDYVPPYDQKDNEDKGMGDRFNINYGMATALKNEAVGPFLDIYTSPSTLAKIPLKNDVDPDMKSTWSDIMGDEFTKMMRSWDLTASNMLQLIDIFVTHGISIPWFEDKSTLIWQVDSLENCKFPAEAEAVPSKVEVMTISRTMSAPELFSKIEGHEDDADYNGWNGPEAKKLIESARPTSIDADSWNYEAAARLVKSCRVGSSHGMPVIQLVWGIIRELDGTISVYATTRDTLSATEHERAAASGEDDNEVWLYRKRSSYDDANQAFQIFPFSVGNKNRIYTIRGFGYAVFEPGQADNILRCKMMDSARHRASEIYQPDSTVDSIEDLQFIDLGHAMIAPRGLKGVPQMNSMRMDENIGFVLESNQQVMNKHSAGLASNSISNNPNARRNELQVTAELEATNKMQGFAVSLYYGPYDKLIRELVRRAFNESQSDLAVAKMVERMKEACIDRGVPRDVLGKIDLEAVQAVRLIGAGSKGSRLIGFQQMGELFSSMDAKGQEFFNYDFASEIKGSEAAERYFGIPGQRRSHMDVQIARLENNDLLDGQMIEPDEGENRMVHLEVHIEELIAGIEQVNQGGEDIAEWTIKNIPLYKHCVETLEITTVNPQRMGELNSYRQQIQQAGEIIDNGLRHINKMQEEGDMSQGLDPQGNPIPGQEGAQSAGQADNNLKMAKMFAEAQAKIEIMRQTSAAQLDIERQKAMAQILTLDAKTAADIRRKEILAKAALG